MDLTSKMSDDFRATTDELVKALFDSMKGVTFPDVDFSGLLPAATDLGSWLPAGINFSALTGLFPSNLDVARLEDIEGMNKLAKLSRNTGIPITWSTPPAVLDQLLEAANDVDCHALLLANEKLILDYLVDVLSTTSGNWVGAAKEAANAALHGSYALAQSHAANLIDSIVLSIYAPSANNNPREARNAAESRAVEGIDLDEHFVDFAEHLTVLPIERAFQKWFPGHPFLNAFNRHATAHCVGEEQVFSQGFALVAVMFAASLARQHSQS